MFNLKPEIIYIAVIVILFMYMCPTQGKVITKKVSNVAKKTGVTGVVDSVMPKQFKDLVFNTPPGIESFTMRDGAVDCPPGSMVQDGNCVPEDSFTQEGEVEAAPVKCPVAKCPAAQDICGKPVKRLDTDSTLPFLGLDDPQHPGLTYIGNRSTDKSWVDDAKTNTQLLTTEHDPQRMMKITPPTVTDQHFRRSPVVKYDPNFMAKLNRQATVGNYNTGL